MIVANFFRNYNFGGIPSGEISPDLSPAPATEKEKKNIRRTITAAWDVIRTLKRYHLEFRTDGT